MLETARKALPDYKPARESMQRLVEQEAAPIGDMDVNTHRKAQISVYVRFLKHGICPSLAPHVWTSLGSIAGSLDLINSFDWSEPYVFAILANMFHTLIRHISEGIGLTGAFAFETKNSRNRSYLILKSWIGHRMFELCLGSYDKHSPIPNTLLPTIIGLFSAIERKPSAVALIDLPDHMTRAINDYYREGQDKSQHAINVPVFDDSTFLKVVHAPTLRVFGSIDIHGLFQLLIRRLGDAINEKWIQDSHKLKEVSKFLYF